MRISRSFDPYQSFFVLLFSVVLPVISISAQEPTNSTVKTIQVSEIHAGMKGYALTVFSGVKPEEMGVEVLGVLHNANGPRGDLIMIKLTGEKAEFTGVVAGMSGSPVYFDGRLAGALSYRFGIFSKEPIAGVTPIADMLEIDAMDHSPSGFHVATIPPTSGNGDSAVVSVSSSGQPVMPELQDIARTMTPIAVPLAFNGFTEDAVRRFAPYFASTGIQPVMGVGSSTGEAQPEPLEPGSAVSALLVTGDMDISGTCTVTYIDPEHLLACGHPLLQSGAVDIPMTKAQVLTTLSSSYASFKIINTTEPAGAFVQDRQKGILGRFGETARMVPVTMKVSTLSANGKNGIASSSKNYNIQVLNHAALTPAAMMTAVFSALSGMNDYGEETSFRVDGKIHVENYPDVELHNVYVPVNGMPTAFSVAIGVGDRFTRIFENPSQSPKITGVELSMEQEPERRWMRIESARASISEVRPGDEFTIEAVLKPYRGDRITVQIPVKAPASLPKGNLRIMVSDADTLDRPHRTAANQQHRLELGSTIAAMNKERKNDQLYVTLLTSSSQALIEDKVMPNMPQSVLNVMDSLRSSQDMVVQGESSAAEFTLKLGYAIYGSQVLTVQVK